MVGILIKVLLGGVLFVGALVGGLAATGRLNHEGTANIPVLGGFFPEPPAEPELGPDGQPIEADPHATDPHGEPADATHAGDPGTADASHEGEQGQGPKKPRRSKVGKSVVNPEEPAGDGHGGGHGADPHGGEADAHGGGHGEEDAHGSKPNAGKDAHGKGKSGNGGHAKKGGGAHGDLPERDFDGMQRALQSQGKIGYKPGAFFQFNGMPSGLTPEQLNEAWQRVEGVLQAVKQRETALDLRETELQELADDISRRWKELGEERLKIEQMQRQLDAKIQKFQQTVTLVRNDEVALLKRNAETLAAFERSKAAELLEQQWTTERGQEEVLKLLEFMDKDAVTEILAALPNPLVQDILKKRLTVSKEAKPSGGRD